MTPRLLLTLGFVALLSCACPRPGDRTAWADDAPAASPDAVVGAAAPDFSLPLADGKGSLRLSSLRGRPVILTFWAFWCDTWREVRAGYRALADSRVPASLLAVAIDPTRRELLTQEDEAPPAFYPILIDTESRVSEQYRVRGVPTVLVLDDRGRIRYRCQGWPGTRKLIDALH